ncbi:MAG: hypothetical protein OXL38_20550, partial [Gammaproteobacteria bacterium]|nr:hypothetical protein [Gammaproteobacteria bacterium]
RGNFNSRSRESLWDSNDSAMTVAGSTTKGSTKIYPGDKLFALTKHHPVGVMIYHSDEFMGVPWETLIKMYRHSLGSKSRASVAAYVDDLLAFISKEPFTNDERDLENLLRMARGAFCSARFDRTRRRLDRWR